jgi:autophagy-related protein 2
LTSRLYADHTGSIDEDTFRRLPDPISGMDLIEDDLPTNLDYLDAASRTKREAAGDGSEGLRAWQTEHDDLDNNLASEINGETIKILVPGPISLQEDYWDTLPISETATASVNE